MNEKELNRLLAEHAKRMVIKGEREQEEEIDGRDRESERQDRIRSKLDISRMVDKYGKPR